MTVPVNSRRREYEWTGAATQFDGPMAFDKTHIAAFVNTGGVVRQLPASDLTVSRLGRPSTRVTIATTDIEVGATLILLRVMPYTQEVDIANLGAFHAETMEKADDALAMQIQQLADGVDRSFRLSDTSAGNVDFTIDTPAAGALLGWNAAGTRLESYPAEQFVTTATAGVSFTVGVSEGQTVVPVSGLKTPWSAQGVFYNGIYQSPSAYTRNGTSIVFSEPLPAPGEVVVIAVFGGPTNVTEADMLTYKRASAGGVTRPVSERLSDTLHARDYVTDFVGDATEQVRALHAEANATGLSVSYQGVDTISVQADAGIVINTDVDFAGCEFRLLNGIVPDPEWGGHMVLFRVYDEATPYVATALTRSDLSLRKGEMVPFGASAPAGFYSLQCNYLISNRAKDGTSQYEQVFRLDSNGVAQFPLSADASTATTASVHYRPNSARGPIHIRGARFRSDDFNHLVAFDVERNQVRLSAVRIQDFAVEPVWEDITSFIRIQNAADVDIIDMNLPGRTSWVAGVEVSGGYLFNPEGAANLTFDNVRATNRNSVMGSNRVNGMFVRNSVLNRVDVHTSGHNLFVENTVLYRRGICVGWGGGVISARNVTTYDSPVITDREDYGGSFFGGQIEVSGCTMYGDYNRTAFFVEFCAYSRVAVGTGVGSIVETFMPDSITIRDCVRRAPIPSGGNHVVGGVRMYTAAGRSDLGKVYAPLSVFIDNIRMEGAANYRNGNMVALREMWPNASGDSTITITNCPGSATALNAFNAAGRTLHTGTSTLASSSAPSQSQAARGRVYISNSGNVVVECTITGGEVVVTDCRVQRVMCSSTDASQRQSVSVADCRLVSPVLEGAETAGQVKGYNPSAFFPVSLKNCIILGNFDVSNASSLQGVMSATSVTVTLPAGATTATAFTGWKHASFWS